MTNENSNPYSNLEELDQTLRTWFAQVLDSVVSSLNERDDRQDQLFDQFEMQLAMLTKAYAELAAIVEASVSFIVNKSDSDREEFFKHISTARQTMMDSLKHATKTEKEEDI